MVYRPVPRREIIAALAHMFDLHRRVKPSNENELRANERREAAARDLLSNLPRTNEHPTLKTLLEVAEICSLTLEGAHKLFGYNLLSSSGHGFHRHMDCPVSEPIQPAPHPSTPAPNSAPNKPGIAS